jgi:hypothetical protein
VTINDSAADKFAAMNFENALLNCRDEYVRLSVAQRAAFRADIRALVDFFERERRAGEEPTTTPDDTLREAGISSERQAQYQRRMSSLLGRGGA